MKLLAQKFYHALVPEKIRALIYRYIGERKMLKQLQDGSVRVSFIGPWNYQLGLGSASKSYLQALIAVDVNLNAYGITVPLYKHIRTTKIHSVLSFDGDADICLISLHPEMWDSCLTKQYKNIIRKSSFRVGVLVFETACIPPEWNEALQTFDAVLVPSVFCAHAFAATSNLPVEVAGYVVSLPDLSFATVRHHELREALSLPSNAKIMLFAFDSMNIMSRKNPEALVRAFKHSRLANEGWILVLKTKNLYEHKSAADVLLAEISNDKAITIINEAYSNEAMTSLYLGCDIYVSPHASEGFGLTVAEAMAAQKLVVATDYSATSEFLDCETGYPVAYTLIEMGEQAALYDPKAIWAKVDEADLSLKLTKAAHDFDEGHFDRAIKARQRIADRFSEKAVGHALADALERWQRIT